jgi:hypothetical protein
MKRHMSRPPKSPPSPKSAKRPNHKRQLRLNEANEAISRLHPEPMTLIHKREKMIREDFPPVYRKPPHTLGTIDKAATAMAQWENSDPFSYNRTALYVRQGYLEPQLLIEEMEKRTLARRVARAREVERGEY